MKGRGFTIIELLIAIAITTIILLVVIVPFKKMNEKQVLYKENDNVVTLIKQARSMTVSSKYSLQYGIHLATTSVTLFQGAVYSDSDPGNMVLTLNPLVNISGTNISGGNQIVFNRLNGSTQNIGTITISMIASSTQTAVITVNQTGVINSSL
jgi:prepilin-type N-terminal cleavage/methylation domain-containing protein